MRRHSFYCLIRHPFSHKLQKFDSLNLINGHTIDTYHFSSFTNQVRYFYLVTYYRPSPRFLKQNLHLNFSRNTGLKEYHKTCTKFSAIDQIVDRMKCWVQVITTPTADTPGTVLLLHFDSKRYLIGNVAEGTQRVIVQRRTGLMKLSDIFLSGTVGWGNAGGLLGIILTTADLRSTSLEEKQKALKTKEKSKYHSTTEKNMNLTVHGGRNLTHLLASTRRFIFRTGMPIFTNEFTSKRETTKTDWEPTWRDENIKVWAMVIKVEGSSEKSKKRNHGEFSDDNSECHDKYLHKESDQSDTIRKSVLSSMFDSSWRADGYVKKKLFEVQQPATIYTQDLDGNIEKYSGPLAEDDPSVANLDVLIRTPWPGARIDRLPPTTQSNSSICYIIKNYPQRGRFNTEKATSLGVKIGPDCGRLIKGESVKTPEGNIVTPDMVLDVGKEGNGFAVFDLPDKSYIGALLTRKELSSDILMSNVGVIFWILGPGVLGDTRLKKFMQEHKEFNHIVSSKDCCPNYLALESSGAAAIRLSILDPDHFPIPDYQNETQNNLSQEVDVYTKAKNGLIVHLEPLIEIQDLSAVPFLNTTDAIYEIPDEALNLAKAARRETENPEFLRILAQNQADIPCKDTEVITLGTGSSIPSKYRNVSATMVRVPDYGNFLMDCGENTLGQLKRVFGSELPTVLRNLKVIWVSHLHADHHLGIASVIKAWNQATNEHKLTRGNRLIVASNSGMKYWLDEYAEVEDYGYSRINCIIMNKKYGLSLNSSSGQLSQTGLTSIQACPVEHCLGALAVVFNFPNGFKFAYSGDCRPSDKFIEIGHGATLLIHEATFDDVLYYEAHLKKHSTTSEALEVGRKMKARRILLTHFSQRYQKIPVMNENDGNPQVAIVAFDYMKIRIEDFAKMEALKPAIIKLYEERDEDEDEDEDKEKDIEKND